MCESIKNVNRPRPRRVEDKKAHQVLYVMHASGQIIATSQEFSPQNVADEGKSPYFQQI